MKMDLPGITELIKDAGERCAIAGGGFGGMADAISTGSPSAENLAELREHGQKVVDAVPVAVQQMRDCANAIERLGNLLWAALRDSNGVGGADGPKGGE